MERLTQISGVKTDTHYRLGNHQLLICLLQISHGYL